jgi:hypothetical protein
MFARKHPAGYQPSWLWFCLVGTLVSTLLAASVADAGKIPVVPLSQQCLTNGRKELAHVDAGRSLPIADECVAAAIAERTFLKWTEGKVAIYEVFRDPFEPPYVFVIEMGNKDHPPGPGAHAMVSVDPATGRTELTPGQ